MRILTIAAAASFVIGSALAQPNAPAGPAGAPNATTPVAPSIQPNRVEPTTPAPGNPAAAPNRSARPATPAIKTTPENNPGAPVEGANSFTESQAKARIESRGFSNVSGLIKDERGVWRGTAQKDGKTVQISLDFQGNVVAD